MCRKRSIPHVYANEPACLTLLPRCTYEPAVSGGCHHDIQQNALQTVVGESIDKYTRSTQKPPFSAVELVALAWFCIEMVPMPMVREDILWWILAEFDYYRMIDKRLDDDEELSQDSVALRRPCSGAGRYYPKIEHEDGMDKIACTLNPRPLPKVLALLRTCRQIRDEAVPYFYRDNALRFTLKDMGQVLSRLAPSRAEHLSNVYINFCDLSRITQASAQFGMLYALGRLVAVNRLRRLELESAPEDDKELETLGFAHVAIGVGIKERGAITSFEQIPMFVQLALVAARARELVFTDKGLCPRIEGWILGEVERLRQAEGQSGAVGETTTSH
ncbi:hypothetical protein B0A55_08240 [Friedmanniomyces simplex]|uniref:DUF7730 domain-containing protein n=1 Tax=Friedmanniomyces simplex TaxID=329884 RepID=A0A4U0WYP5_9PEZI|nr:hypothetical protein B0A55_08240 [Friedmanniomyces simplex]